MRHDPLAGFVAELKPKHTEKTVTILIKIVRGHAYHDVNDGVMCTIDHDRPMYGYDDPRRQGAQLAQARPSHRQ